LKPSAPLPVDAVTSPHAHQGPPENTAEHAALVAKHGFAHRTLLGKLSCAYVACRPDIGYATIALSKFSTCLHDHHFAMLKKVAKCLRATKDWGIKKRQSQTDASLPPSNFIRSTIDAELPDFPTVNAQEPVAFLDVAHANHRSAACCAFLLCGGAISHRCKTQSITATSSTEAEFLAAVATAKHARHMRAIVADLGFPRKGPTVMCCDS